VNNRLYGENRGKTGVFPAKRAGKPKSTALTGGSTPVPAYAILAREGDTMIEAIQIPILLKAIDFLFDEGRKILEERRERRKADEAPPVSAEPEPVKVTPPVEESPMGEEIQKEETNKQELLTSKVDERSWQDNEEEVQHLVRLLETYSRNYHLAKEQYAKWGSALVPPIILHNLTEAEDSMLKTTQRLESILSKVYKKDILINQ
jgi:hypothetical protein